MKKIVSFILLIFLSFSPSIALGEQDKSFGKKVGEVARDVKEGTSEAFQETQKAVKGTSKEVTEGSKSLWQKAKNFPKKFWRDVKEGFQEDE